MRLSFLAILLICVTNEGLTQDTLYFRLSNPWNTVKDLKGEYIRKCVKESDYYHIWDYNKKNTLVTESFYPATNFTRKLFCHKYFNETNGLLTQSRCYQNGRLNGYFVIYDAKGDTTSYDVYENGTLVNSWSVEPRKQVPPFTMNEKDAEFPGGQNAWIEYLNKNLIYPDSLHRIQGQVHVRFVINANGTIETVEIVKSLYPQLDQEVIRVLKKSPKWKPARQNGKKVKSIITQPVNFR